MLPCGQVRHSVADGPEQVAQDASQASQTVFAVAAQAAVWYSPSPQAAHGPQAPPFKYDPAGQLVQSVRVGPSHVVHEASHALHTALLVPPHTTRSYWPGKQVAHAVQVPSLR